MTLQSRVMRLIERAASRRGKNDRLTMALAIALFAGGLVFAIWTRPAIPADANWALLLLVPFIGVPVTVWASALEYQISVDIAGHQAPIREAMRVSVLASAANLLPIPGSVIVRTGAMRRLGASTSKALISAAVVGIGWVGISAALTGALLLASNGGVVGSITFASGVVLLISTLLLVRANLPGGALLMTAKIIVIEALSVGGKAFRLFVILHAFGYDVDSGQAMALALASVIVTALGFFPAGLGATELLTAATGPLVDLPAAVGLLAAAADRILGLAMLGLLAVPLLRRERSTAQSDASSQEPNL